MTDGSDICCEYNITYREVESLCGAPETHVTLCAVYIYVRVCICVCICIWGSWAAYTMAKIGKCEMMKRGLRAKQEFGPHFIHLHCP